MARKPKRKSPNNKRERKPSKLGLAPGTLVFTGTRQMDQAKVSVIQYNGATINEFEAENHAEIPELISGFDGITWINIDGLHEVELIEQIGGYLELHKLTMEDIVSTGQRAKIDEHEQYLYLVLRMFMVKDEDQKMLDEQLSFVMKENVLVTFQEFEGDVFNHVRRRLHEGRGMIRKRAVDYLLYALVDSVVDYYFQILELMGDKVEEMELSVLDNPEQEVLNELHQIRREILYLRRSVYPLREVVSRLEKLEEPVVSAETQVFIRDLYDHTIQVIETVEVFRDMASGMLDLYMNSVSNKMNNVMKVLTIIATIFIPLTFIAGVYGMNFENMPELQWQHGYLVVWALMIAMALGMVIYFRRKKWF